MEQASIDLIDEHAASTRLGVSTRVLQAWRQKATGPAFVKVGRCVRYRVAELERYIEANTFTSTRSRAVPETARLRVDARSPAPVAGRKRVRRSRASVERA